MMAIVVAFLAWNASGQNVADWPLRVLSGSNALTLYEPRIEDWQEGEAAGGRAVFAVTADRHEPVFGTIWFNMRLRFDELGATASVLDFEVETIRLPAASALAPEQVVRVLQRALPNRRLATEALRQSHLRESSEREHWRDFAEQPLTLIWSPRPTVVVRLDGEPLMSSIPGTSLQRVINTESLVLFDSRDQRWYLALADHWRTAEDLYDEWLPLEIEVEYIGEPQFETVGSLDLYYAANTRHSIVRVQSDYYLCFEGAWYRGRSSRGPGWWQWPFPPQSTVFPYITRFILLPLSESTIGLQPGCMWVIRRVIWDGSAMVAREAGGWSSISL